MAQEMIGTIKYEEEIIKNSRGLELFTCRWTPTNTEPKTLVFLCHGYAMECSISTKNTAIRLAKAGYGVYRMDYEGHGKSSGLHGYVPSFGSLVDDCSDHFSRICGESMGGAVVLHLHRKRQKYRDGAILVAPLCKIRSNPLRYKGRPRLKTANELLDVSLDIEKNLEQVSLPFLVVHGGDDKVTDPAVSRLLLGLTFKLYPGMWHALTSGEPAENIDIVFADLVSWLKERTEVKSSSILEREQKRDDDTQFKMIHAGKL
ncbi:hypothetical protein MKX01_032162 [Papaver californicum]|nr:hypothetical protein MKX01_032162 [Papaver californicum]